MTILVIDINKGIQTQTAEGIVIASVTVDNMLVVLNKVDQIPADQREKKVARTIEGIRKGLAKTKFKDAPMIPFSTKVKGEKKRKWEKEMQRGIEA